MEQFGKLAKNLPIRRKMTEFSIRTNWNIEESDLARAHRERLQQGLEIFDLTASNPTRCGFDYAQDLLSALGRPEAFDYNPDPRGLLDARLAVSAYYADHGAAISPDNMILTTSTSEAYTYLFKLLLNPGDAIVVPQPSYPLFDFLAQAESIEVKATPLIYDYGWQLDFESLRRLLQNESGNAKIRALVLVHPNNPTGHFTTMAESRELAEICREYKLALIVDEVFLDYSFAGGTTVSGELAGEISSRNADQTSFAVRDLDLLTFVVSGISKICGLPQMKAAWLVALGPGSDKALARLEILADTYLSMNAPVQCALGAWLAARQGIQAQILNRVGANLAVLDHALTAHPLVSRLMVQGGWYAVLRIPATHPDEITARHLLGSGVWIHPGYFFGFAPSGWLVVSLLTETHAFQEGITRVLQNVVLT
jgi:aspartate/methionine/tyrosine aminotransferase